MRLLVSTELGRLLCGLLLERQLHTLEELLLLGILVRVSLNLSLVVQQSDRSFTT